MHYAIVAELGRTPSAFCITPNAMGALRAIWLTNFYYLCGGYYYESREDPAKCQKYVFG